MAQYCMGQSILSGKVLDASTKQPIANVSIFLSHTTIGTVSNEKGEFVINHVPSGKFELIATSLNYENYITTIESATATGILTIQMNPSSNTLQEVIVEPYDDDGWKKWGSYFKTHFIGNFSLVRNCKLLNTEVVKFRFNKNKNLLRVFAHENLVFENKSLGYIIKYVLERFEIDFNNNTFKYIGYPLFENMVPKNAEQQRKWDTARAIVYRGSLRHFMRSLFSNQLAKDGFEVRVVQKITKEEKERVKEIIRVFDEMEEAGLKPRLRVQPDSLNYYNKIRLLADSELMVIMPKPLSRDSLVVYTRGAVEKSTSVLFWFQGLLRVTYLHKQLPYDYAATLQKTSDNNFITTDILVSDNGVTIYKNGNYFNGENLLTDGYWSWSEKLSTMLPSDYWPVEKKN